MIGTSSTRTVLENYKHKAGKNYRGHFVKEVLHLLGLVDTNGRRYVDRHGAGILKDPVNSKGLMEKRLDPREFSLRDLAEGIIGENWAKVMNPDNVRRANLVEQTMGVMEAGTGAIAASQFADINAFTAVVSGLLEISVLEQFRAPDFIADKLMPTQNTKMFAGRKVIGATRIGDKAEQRQPGMPTARVQIGERWITMPNTVENALSAEVTQEAVYLDLTGEVLQNAGDVGYWLGYRKEIRCIDAKLGITNTYSYKGTSYNTYLSNGYYNNDITGNELVHWDQVQNTLVVFRNMLDPETNTRIQTRPNRVLVNLEKLVTARSIMGDLAAGVEYRDAPGSSTQPQEVRAFQSPYKGDFEILTSPLVYQRMTDANGLNLSASTAGKYWFMWEEGKDMTYEQNWPIRVQQAAPNQLDMIDRGVVLFVKADERGVPMVREPRRIVRCRP